MPLISENFSFLHHCNYCNSISIMIHLQKYYIDYALFGISKHFHYSCLKIQSHYISNIHNKATSCVVTLLYKDPFFMFLSFNENLLHM